MVKACWPDAFCSSNRFNPSPSFLMLLMVVFLCFEFVSSIESSKSRFINQGQRAKIYEYETSEWVEKVYYEGNGDKQAEAWSEMSKRLLESERVALRYLNLNNFPAPLLGPNFGNPSIDPEKPRLVMQFIDGMRMDISLFQSLGNLTNAHINGQILAKLHLQLHELSPPGNLRLQMFDRSTERNDYLKLLHFDLIPSNVILSPSGPLLIDWESACLGSYNHSILTMAYSVVKVLSSYLPKLKKEQQKNFEISKQAFGKSFFDQLAIDNKLTEVLEVAEKAAVLFLKAHDRMESIQVKTIQDIAQRGFCGYSHSFDFCEHSSHDIS